MKYLLFTFTVIMFIINIGGSQYRYGSLLPNGKYRIKTKAVTNCNINTNKNMIQFNLYTFPKGNDTIEIRGNITVKTTINDTMEGELIFAFKDPNGNWIENVLSQRSKRYCSMLKEILGSAFPSFWKSLGFPELKSECRIPVGTYIAPGLDMSIFENSNFPKTFIFGTYKIQLSQIYKNQLFGCILIILELKRA